MWSHINLAVRVSVCVYINAPTTRLGGVGDILGRAQTNLSDSEPHFMTLQREERWIGSLYVLSREYNMGIKGFAAM